MSKPEPGAPKPGGLLKTLGVLVLAGAAFVGERLGLFRGKTVDTGNPPVVTAPAEPKSEPRSVTPKVEPPKSEAPKSEAPKPAPRTEAPKPAPKPAPKDDGGAAAVLAAFKAQRSNVQLEVRGKVRAVLADDNDGSRHQKFILELQNGHTVLVAHNIDLADRVPVAKADEVTLYGEYEWSDKGGVLHWTHHDPAKRHKDGWIKHKDKTYK